MRAPDNFSEWYKQKLGFRPAYIQALLWFFYGFIWIPLWYFSNVRGADGQTENPGLTAQITDDTRLVSGGKRLMGYVVDLALGVGLGVALVSALSPAEQQEVGSILIVVTPFYSTMFLEAIFGRSLGKLLTGTKVVITNGEKPGWGRAFLRMIVRFIPFEALSFRNGVMWHDSLSGTRVVANATNSEDLRLFRHP